MSQERMTLAELREECPTAWRELDDRESGHGLWRTGYREYKIIYSNTGFTFHWSPQDGWHSPGEECPW